MRYRLTKTQVKRLIDGKYVTDGSGRKYASGDNMKEVLQILDEKDLYDKFDVIIEDGKFDLVKKAV